MSKKVLFVNSTLTAGGSEKVMTIIANQFAERGYDVSMILVRKSEKDTYSLHREIKLTRFTYKHQNSILKNIEKIIKLRKNIKENKYDVIISFMNTINTSVLLAGIGLKVPTIVSERCDPASRNYNKFISMLENRCYKLAKTIVLQTEQVKMQYPNYLQNKLVVISNPISENVPDVYGGQRKNKIVAAGRLTEQKNFQMLIDAFNAIQKVYSNYELYIFGDGELRIELEQQIKKLGLQEKIHLPGFVQNVDEQMKDAMIYVSSSNYEGISNSMLEALAMGIPTISTDCPVGGAAMTIRSGENGILIPVGDTDSLKKALFSLLEDENYRLKLSQNAVKIREQLNPKLIAEEWMKLIE